MGLFFVGSKAPAHPCARVGHPIARLVIRMPRLELAECPGCGEPIWTTPAGRDSGFRLVCTVCFQDQRTSRAPH